MITLGPRIECQSLDLRNWRGDLGTMDSSSSFFRASPAIYGQTEVDMFVVGCYHG